MTKKLILIIVVSFIFTTSASAHPGRTDSSGGHTCRTNCEKWGLDYGEYHYHNGGGSGGGSGGSSSSGSSSKSYDPQAEYDKGYKAGQAIGYEKGARNDSSATEYSYTTDEFKNGWNDGFKQGWNDGVAEWEKKEKEAEDARKGEAEGLLDGEDAFTAGKKKDELARTAFPSSAYEKAYVAAYPAGWELGRNKSEYNKRGYEDGLLTDTMQLPAETKDEAALLQAYKEGFEEGVAERDEAEINKYREIGYEDGTADILNPPDGVKDLYVKAYVQGHEKGLEQLKQNYFQLGYQAAFAELEYAAPAYPKQAYMEWHRDGFDSNTEVVEIRKTAVALGRSGTQLVPAQYEHASQIFEYYLASGKAQAARDRRNLILWSSAVAAAWLGRRMFIAWKMTR